MGKKDGGAGAIAEEGRRDEQERQQRIREGTRRINSIFDGGVSSGVDPIIDATTYDPTRTYYTASGGIWSPSGSKDDLGQSILEFTNAVGRGEIFGSTQSSGGQFTDDFYNRQRQNYIDYATPQLEDQYGNAKEQLTYALTRGGNLDSSARAKLEGDLTQKYNTNKQQIADQGLAYETQARNNVEEARSQLISMLNSTGDATGAANQALARASALSTPPPYSTLSNLFADFTSGLGTQAAVERANYYSGGQTGARYNTGLFAPNPNAVSVS